MNVKMTLILRASVCLLLFLGVFGIQRIHRFTQRTSSEGQPLCFADPPSQVIRGVRSDLSCVMKYCASTQGCVSANYRMDTGICELYDFCPGQEMEVQGCRNFMRRRIEGSYFCTTDDRTQSSPQHHSEDHSQESADNPTEVRTQSSQQQPTQASTRQSDQHQSEDHTKGSKPNPTKGQTVSTSKQPIYISTRQTDQHQSEDHTQESTQNHKKTQTEPTPKQPTHIPTSQKVQHYSEDHTQESTQNPTKALTQSNQLQFFPQVPPDQTHQLHYQEDENSLA